MTRVTVAPRECPLCDCRMMEPDAASPVQRGWAAYFAQTRPRERADWLEQYALRPERVR